MSFNLKGSHLGRPEIMWDEHEMEDGTQLFLLSELWHLRSQKGKNIKEERGKRNLEQWWKASVARYAAEYFFHLMA